MATVHHSQRKFDRKKLGLGAAGLALLTAVLAACAQPETQTDPQAGQPTTETEQPQAQESPTSDTTSETAAEDQDLQQLVGQTVDVRGEVGERIGEKVVRLNAAEPYDGQEVLVVLPETFTLPEGEGDTVSNLLVSGEVRQFTADEAEQLQLEIPQEQYSDLENQPLIVADATTLSPTPDQLSENPNLFLDQPIALEGQLEELGPNTYKLSGSGLASGDVLVLTSQAPTQTDADQDVVVTGQAQTFDPAQLQQQYGWEPELQQQLEEDYADKPVVVAEQINPVQE